MAELRNSVTQYSPNNEHVILLKKQVKDPLKVQDKISGFQFNSIKSPLTGFQTLHFNSPVRN